MCAKVGKGHFRIVQYTLLQGRSYGIDFANISWGQDRGVTDSTPVLVVGWSYDAVPGDENWQPSDRSACDVWEAKALFPSHGIPYASPREKAHGLSARGVVRVPRSSLAAYGPETVRCDRLLVRAAVPCSGSLSPRAGQRTESLSILPQEFALAAYRRTLDWSLAKDALVSPSDVQQVARPCPPGIG